MGPLTNSLGKKRSRSRSLSPDSKGYYRPYIGWKMPDWPKGDRRVQHRFNLGKDPIEAQRRYNRIQELYADSCRALGADVWTPFALYAAGLIAQGMYRVPYALQSWVLEDCIDPIAEYGQLLEIERQRYPSIEIIPADPEMYAESHTANRQIERDVMNVIELHLKNKGVITDGRNLPEEIIPGTLHEALKNFIDNDIHGQNVKPGSMQLTQYGFRRVERVNRLIEHSQDLPLYALGLDECKEIANHWRSRPPHKRTRKPTSKGHVDIQLGELKRFFSWLDCSDTYRWRKPRGYDSIRWTIAEALKEKVPVHKQTYSPTELATIAGHLDDMGKFALVLGLNCAMGAAELGRLTISDFLLNYEHEYQRMLKFKSTKEDSFCRFFRPKSKIFGEWLLWQETVNWVRWGISRSQQIGTELLFVDEEGRSWYREESPNPQYVFANMWTNVTEKLKDFSKYPFGSIRDTLPDELRQTIGDELASLCLSHGKRTGADKLIDCYSNRPFGRLHRAIRKVHAFYSPVLNVLGSMVLGKTASPRI
jgi:hypothetical protein